MTPGEQTYDRARLPHRPRSSSLATPRQLLICIMTPGEDWIGLDLQGGGPPDLGLLAMSTVFMQWETKRCEIFSEGVMKSSLLTL
jgi:hypothetical protein